MRDAHRMKEKLDLSLDNRQIVSLLVGAIVVMGAVFVLGVVVGKKLSESGRTENATDILAALDQKKEAMEKAESAPVPELTFQRDLIAPTAAGQPEVRVVTLAPPKPVEAPKPEPKAEPAPVAEETAEETEKPAEVIAAPTPAPAAKPEQHAELAKADIIAKPVPVSAKATTTSTKPTNLAEAIAKAQRQQTTVTASKGAYTVQLSAAPSRAEAERFAQSVKAKGYSPRIEEAIIPGKGTWYRVRLLRFPTKDAAQNYLADFRRETQLDGIVTAAE